jgi:hypothetical protein
MEESNGSSLGSDWLHDLGTALDELERQNKSTALLRCVEAEWECKLLLNVLKRLCPLDRNEHNHI